LIRIAMQIIEDIPELRAQVAAWRRSGERIAFVPTMGNLHAGHLSLVARARELGERVVVSIFVNPLQFGEGEDLQAYPRTPQEDEAQLKAASVDLLFRPREGEVYPHGREGQTFVEVPGLSDILCGASRPGHFRGVATVVAKLFNLVQPDVACFGEKDYQQLTVLRRMAADLNMPVALVGVPTMRESDGLAMSSRNGYLTAKERQIAPALQQILQWIAQRLQHGERAWQALEQEAAVRLEHAGLQPDYISIRRAEDLAVPGEGDRALVILAAAFLGRARLIDNLLINL